MRRRPTAAASACSTSSPSRFTVVDGAGGSVWASIAQVMMCSSSASTASEVKRGAVGSIHSERPSDARRRVASGGSRSTQCSSTRSAARSRVSSQRRPDICDTGRCTSQIARSTSGRPHDECCADTAATTSPTVTGTAGSGSRAAASIPSTSCSTVQPASAASRLPPCRQIGGTVTGLAATRVRRRLTGHRRPFPP